MSSISDQCGEGLDCSNWEHAFGRDRQGSRERVVLIPCSGGSQHQWRKLTAALTGFECRSLDLIGHGDSSPWHGDGALSLLQEVTAIKDSVTDQTPFHLVGHSYGGSVALTYALEHWDRLLSLTLIEPSSFHILNFAEAPEVQLLDEVRAVADAVIRGVMRGNYAAGMEIFVDYWSGKGTWSMLSIDNRNRMMRLSVHIAHHFHALLDDRTPLSRYAQIEVPTLIISGTQSPTPSRAISRIIATAMPNAIHRTARGADHMSAVRDPERINALITEHINEPRVLQKSSTLSV